MSEKLRAGVIGLGAMGANHARVYGEMPEVELVAVADVDETRVAAATAGRGIAGYADYRRMLIPRLLARAVHSVHATLEGVA